jgi:hypothetical protein
MNEFLDHYYEILSDPAHLAVELTLMLLVDGLVLGLLWPLFRHVIDRRLERHHEELDAEHGITHHGDHIHLDPEVARPLADLGDA